MRGGKIDNGIPEFFAAKTTILLLITSQRITFNIRNHEM